MDESKVYLDFDGVEIDARAQLAEIERWDCEQSLATFVQHAWPHMDPAELDWSWHLDAMCQHLEAVADGDIKRLIINVPPRSSKTSIATICFLPWIWSQRSKGPNSGPHVSALYISYNESLSMEHNVAARRLVKSEWYQSLWGSRFTLLDDADTKSSFQNDKGGKRFIASIGSRVTGKGADIIVYDDPNATNDAESEAVLKTTNDFHDNTVRSRLNNKKFGAIICIQQRVAEQDLTGHLLERYPGEYDHFMVPMEFEPDRSFPTSIGWQDPRTEEGELLWPERFDEDFVASEKKNPWVYSAQYLQRPAPRGGGIVKTEWWQPWDAPQYPPFDYVLASLDTAYGAKQTADHSAMTIWGIFSEDIINRTERFIDHEGRIQDGNIGPNVFTSKIMLTYGWSANLQFHDLIQKTIEVCRKYKVDKLLIENKASGISIAQELKRAYRNERFDVQLVNPGNADKVARMHSIVPIFTKGQVYAPDKAWSQMVIDQMTNFPRGRYKDVCDTCSQALRHIREMGLLESRPEVEYDLHGAMQFGGNGNGKLYPV